MHRLAKLVTALLVVTASMSALAAGSTATAPGSSTAAADSGYTYCVNDYDSVRDFTKGYIAASDLSCVTIAGGGNGKLSPGP